MFDYQSILDRAIHDVPSIKPIISYWPSAHPVCLRLAELIMDIIPDPYGDEKSMLHRCLIMGSRKWDDTCHQSDLNRFKAFNDGLIKPLTELIDYRVIAQDSTIWDPLKSTLHEFQKSHGIFRVQRIDYRTDERFIINQRFLSFLMASRILSMEDVFALQALPSRSLLSFA